MVPAGPRSSGIPYPAAMDLGIAGRAGGRGGGVRRAGVGDGPSAGGRRGARGHLRPRRRPSPSVPSPSSRRSAAAGSTVSTPMSAPRRAPRRSCRQARDALGGIDILVPNAGGPPAGGYATTELAAYRARPRAEPAVHRRHVHGGGAGHARAGLGPGRRHHLGVGAPADPRADPLQHCPRGAHGLPEDARPRGGRRRGHGELRAARLPRHRPASVQLGRRPHRRGGSRAHQGARSAGGLRRRGGVPVLRPGAVHHGRRGPGRRRGLPRPCSRTLRYSNVAPARSTIAEARTSAGASVESRTRS